MKSNRALKNLEFWANDGPTSRYIKGRHFLEAGDIRGARIQRQIERRTNGRRKIDGDGFREIVKTTSYVVLFVEYIKEQQLYQILVPSSHILLTFCVRIGTFDRLRVSGLVQVF